MCTLFGWERVLLSERKVRSEFCFAILANLTEIKLILRLRQMQMTRIFSTITMDYMEAFGNNSSVKSVRELQVMRSFWQTADENMAISQPLKRCNKRHITYHRGRDYTVQAKQRKKKKNNWSCLCFWRRNSSVLKNAQITEWPFSYDHEIKFAEHEQNSNRTKRVRFDWVSKHVRGFDWFSERPL